ncbi:MAG: nitrilase-related carbon-nitrogen hydrolase, partial [Ignavibacteria bacterium]
SEVVDPFGNVTALAKFFDEDLIFTEIDFEKIRHARQQARHFLDEDVNFLKEQIRILSEEILKL